MEMPDGFTGNTSLRFTLTLRKLKFQKLRLNDAPLSRSRNPSFSASAPMVREMKKMMNSANLASNFNYRLDILQQLLPHDLCNSLINPSNVVTNRSWLGIALSAFSRFDRRIELIFEYATPYASDIWAIETVHHLHSAHSFLRTSSSFIQEMNSSDIHVLNKAKKRSRSSSKGLIFTRKEIGYSGNSRGTNRARSRGNKPNRVDKSHYNRA
ncbi:hypothetical protein LguiB_005664 [Lonicera macranthoides]